MEGRPRIGITTGTHADWLPGGFAYEAFATAVRESGGEPVRLDVAAAGRERALVWEVDGVLFSGGWDIDLRHFPRPPALNGETAGERMARRRMRTEPARDVFEIPLAQAAVEADRPVLGICRGCQLIAVALGGSLVLDILTEIATDVSHASFGPPERLSSSHALTIVPGTRLASILPPERYRVTNSRHHQAVLPDDTLRGRVSAVSPDDGVVEAFELPDRRFVLGVQWHPEYPKDPEIREAHRPLFEAFVRACRSHH